jgi:hypothetical protein
MTFRRARVPLLFATAAVLAAACPSKRLTSWIPTESWKFFTPF